MLLLIVASSASAAAKLCVGEFAPCPGTGECTMGPCGRCKAGEYLCPSDGTTCVASAAAYETCPGLKGTHLDHTLDIEARIAYLTSRANLTEMISQLQNGASQLERFGIPAFQWLNDDQHGVGRTPIKATVLPNGCGLGATWSTALLREAGVVLGVEARGLHNYFTHNDSVHTTGDDHRAVNADASASCNGCGVTIYGPNLNLVKDPRWGRGQETFGEDPHLMARLVVAWVTGAQNNSAGAPADANGRLLSGLCCKHFAAYNSENIPAERVVFDAAITSRSMWETYMPAFESCIKEAKATHVMCSYNSVNGIPTCANSGLLNTILREQWKFDGFVVSDYDAWANLFYSHHYAPSIEAAAAVGINNGLDQEGGNNPEPGSTARANGDMGKAIKYLLPSVTSGNVTRKTIETAWARQLRVRIRLGLFDPPLSEGVAEYNALDETVAASPAHLTIARRVAEASMTLLKNNDKNALPLDIANIKNKIIAVIGPQATQGGLLMGNYAESASGGDGWGVSILEALKERLPAHLVKSIVYSDGCPTIECVDNATTTAAIAAAVKAVKDADIVIVTLGLDFNGQHSNRSAPDNLAVECEGQDRTGIELPGQQGALVAALRAAIGPSTPLVGLLVHGGTLALGAAGDAMDAIMSVWYPGIEGGHAIAATLVGDVSPAGRTASTWYKSTSSLPFNGLQNGTMDESVGGGITYRYLAKRDEAIYPFGHGLSYTTFAYSDFKVITESESSSSGKKNNFASSTIAPCDEVTVSVVVKNTGSVVSDEVVQIYASFPDASFPTTRVRLVAFTRVVAIAAGERKTVTLVVRASSRAVVDPSASADVYHDSRVLEAGSITLSVGGGQPGYWKGTQSLTLTVASAHTVPLSSCDKATL